MFILDWVTANYAEILGAFAAGYAFALAVVKLTPTKRDDEILASIHDKLAAVSKFIPAPAAKDEAKVAEKPKA